MNKRNLQLILTLFAVVALLSSCTTMSRTMKQANTRVELTKSDFTLSEQVSGEATTIQVFGIDFQRLIHKTTAKVESVAAPSISISFASIPVIGTVLVDPTGNYALYEMMIANEGHDVIFYPQYAKTVKRPFLGMGFIYKKTTVKVTARLGKLNQ